MEKWQFLFRVPLNTIKAQSSEDNLALEHIQLQWWFLFILFKLVLVLDWWNQLGREEKNSNISYWAHWKWTSLTKEQYRESLVLYGSLCGTRHWMLLLLCGKSLERRSRKKILNPKIELTTRKKSLDSWSFTDPLKCCNPFFSIVGQKLSLKSKLLNLMEIKAKIKRSGNHSLLKYSEGLNGHFQSHFKSRKRGFIEINH